MTRGFIINAQNNGDVDYLKCAEVLCRNIKAVMPGEQVTLLTDKMVSSECFDSILTYPNGDLCTADNWKLANDWQVYSASPYEYTIKLEADMYLPRSISHWWGILEPRNLAVASHIRSYTGQVSAVRRYRKIFDENGLPDLYNAITYFKRSPQAENFFSVVRNIFGNWSTYKQLIKAPMNEPATTDVVYAIAAVVCGTEECIFPTFKEMSFVHMKQHIIGTRTPRWTDELVCEILPYTFRIETIPQLYPVHYHIKDFAGTIEEELW